jgi:hypothetical protein
MNIPDKYIPWILVSSIAALGGAMMLFKWNADGPGTHGGGEDLNRKVAAPKADLDQGTGRGRRGDPWASVSGTVRDVQGGPVADATVCAAASSTLLSASDTQWPRCATSGADGRYRISDLFGVQQRVSAGAAGYLPADHVTMRGGVRGRAIDLRPGGAAEDVDVTLTRGGVEIRGIVLDLGGAPIAGARVASGGPGSGSGIVWGRSGVDGRYTLWVRPGTVTVTAQATGHALASVTGPAGDREFALYLAPAAVLRGQVHRADDHTPIEGAWVRASPHGGAVRTDQEGRFVFDALPPGEYKPWAETDDGFGMAAEQVSLGLGETSRRLAITVQPAVFVEGRIVHTPGGAACDDGTLTPARGEQRARAPRRHRARRTGACARAAARDVLGARDLQRARSRRIATRRWSSTPATCASRPGTSRIVARSPVWSSTRTARRSRASRCRRGRSTAARSRRRSSATRTAASWSAGWSRARPSRSCPPATRSGRCRTRRCRGRSATRMSGSAGRARGDRRGPCDAARSRRGDRSPGPS